MLTSHTGLRARSGSARYHHIHRPSHHPILSFISTSRFCCTMGLRHVPALLSSLWADEGYLLSQLQQERQIPIPHEERQGDQR